MMDTRKVSIFFLLYALASVAIFFAAAFTSLAAIVYVLTLLPFYLVCLLYCLSLSLKNARKRIKLPRWLCFASLGCQLAIVLTSPADCYGWSQGRACYSFLQAHLLNTGAGLQPDPPHWSLVEILFPVSLLLYAIFVAGSLRMMQLED